MLFQGISNPAGIKGYGVKVQGKCICTTPRIPPRISPHFENYGGKNANIAKVMTSQMMAVLAVLGLGFWNGTQWSNIRRFCHLNARPIWMFGEQLINCRTNLPS